MIDLLQWLNNISNEKIEHSEQFKCSTTCIMLKIMEYCKQLTTLNSCNIDTFIICSISTSQPLLLLKQMFSTNILWFMYYSLSKYCYQIFSNRSSGEYL